MNDLDLERLLAGWFEADARGAVPRDGLDRTLAVVSRRAQRRRWAAALHDLARRADGGRTGMLPNVGVIAPAPWRPTAPALAWLILLAALALLTALTVGAAILTRQGPPATRLVYADDTGLTIVAPSGAETTLTHEVVVAAYSDPRWSPSARYVSALVKGTRELRVFEVTTGAMVGDTHGVIDYRWVRRAADGSDLLLIRHGSAVQLLTPDLEPVATIDAGDAVGTFDSSADGSSLAIAAGRTVEVLDLAAAIPAAPVPILDVVQDSVRQIGLSPDGRWVAVLTAPCPDACDGTLQLVPTAGGQATTVEGAIWPGSALAWRADGGELLATMRAGGHLQPVAVRPDGSLSPLPTGDALGSPGITSVIASWDATPGGYLLAVSTASGGDPVATWRVEMGGATRLLVSGVNGASLTRD